MQTALTPEPRHNPLRRFLRLAGWLLLWATVLVLGLFGIVFSFANYPWFGIGIVLLICLLVGYSERKRRERRAWAERLRERNRARRR